MPKLSPESEGAQSTSASCSARCSASPETRPRTSIERHRLGVGEVAEHVLALGADHGEAAGHVLDQGAESGQQDRQALALLRAADEEHAQLLARRLRPLRRGGDVDAVGDHLVVAAEPAPPGPGGRLGDGDPRREPVEDAPGAERRGDAVGQCLGRVGVEGADRGGVGAERGVPADQRHHRLVDVDDVEVALVQLAARGDHAAGREGREVGDRAVGGEARRAPERDQVVGDLARLRRGTVQGPAEAAGRIEWREHANVMAAAEELLRKRLHVPVHAALVGPGIWRDECNSHEPLRVVDRPEGTRGAAQRGRSLQAKLTKTSR